MTQKKLRAKLEAFHYPQKEFFRFVISLWGVRRTSAYIPY